MPRMPMDVAFSVRPPSAVNFSDFTVPQSFLLLKNHNDLITEVKAFSYFPIVIPQCVSNE